MQIVIDDGGSSFDPKDFYEEGKPMQVRTPVKLMVQAMLMANNIQELLPRSLHDLVDRITFQFEFIPSYGRHGGLNHDSYHNGQFSVRINGVLNLLELGSKNKLQVTTKILSCDLDESAQPAKRFFEDLVKGLGVYRKSLSLHENEIYKEMRVLNVLIKARKKSN